VIGACCGKNVVNIYYEQKEFLVCPAVECLIPDRVIEIDAECRNNKCEGIINNERTCEEFKEFLDKIDFQEKEYTYSDIFNQGVNRIKERFPEFECQSVAA
jgi:hypothetical protein